MPINYNSVLKYFVLETIVFNAKQLRILLVKLLIGNMLAERPGLRCNLVYWAHAHSR